MTVKIERLITVLRSLQPSEDRDEILKVAYAMRSNSEARDLNYEEAAKILHNRSYTSPDLREWGEEMKSNIDEYVRLGLEWQRLGRRLEELQARL